MGEREEGDTNVEYWAHSKENRPEAEWQTIESHSTEVAASAGKFAAAFDAFNWGYTVGRLHDLGKYKKEFQEKLRGKNAHVDHATAGAVWAMNEVKPTAFAKILAYCIAGHHTGIPDGSSGTDDTCLDHRLKNNAGIPKDLPTIENSDLELPAFVLSAKKSGRNQPSGFSMTFFTRMLFSCLKDADCLDTEAFLEPEKFSRRGNYPTLEELKSKYDDYIQTMFSRSENTPLNNLRNKIRRECIAKAQEAPGLFSLTVPTGGGKTLSSMAFALEHALKHNFERIIYVIPYTSIIEQTAKEFKAIFGNENVMEHHSNFTPPAKDDEYRNELELRRLLATENWDAPIIVTTNVQFFESLFHNKTSKVRKIHNIARSVVILDEAQMLPVPLLQPTIEAIRELAEGYHTTLVLCTATQPALNDTELKGGLSGVREIMKDPLILEEAFARVYASVIGRRTDKELAELFMTHHQVLCIVNTRDHARLLYTLIGEEEGQFHLSALMCPEHRSRVLEEIKRRLRDGKVCRVISTQLVEAGVDIDFPVVYRAVAGLDSIVQSAGRCNRENRIKEGGKVFVFLPETGLPKGGFKQAAQITENLLKKYSEDLLSSEAVKDYFNELYWIKSLGNSLDEKRILDDCKTGEVKLDFPFKAIAGKYRIIEQIMESVIIPYDETARRQTDELRSGGPKGEILRTLQRYTVGVYPHQFAFLKTEGFIETIDDTYHVLNEIRYKDAYSRNFGLNPSCKEFCDPENLCI
jgi:CRISPR-associated endonuclease/helicase Cas3